MRQVTLAVKTMALIDAMLERDQGALYRLTLQKVLPHLEDAYRGKDDAFRGHMGASMMGGSCGRAIWYSFRWYTKPHFPGRILRLFNRGHLEEGRIIALLLAAGIEVWQQDENGKQFRISGSHGHYGGSGDGIARGLPDLPPGTPVVLEFKTHNDKSFASIVKDGVRASKLVHWVQTQQYMRKMSIAVTLYVAVNKNDDSLYMELIPIDTAAADQYIERADKLIWMKEEPARIGNPPSPGNFECKWCDHKPVCWLKAEPDRNCRTCAKSEPVQTGNAVWRCHLHNVDIPKEVQLTGCDWYVKR